ncbi:hypothetical protein Vadar_024645 [Vaccinium darrowii]|uniref:Uncharacterized protein n=1 Tax=Vaccinium darrowii TaxID=229202 RepID=A0ACB7X450_9ERIC|nr:hypothetical protein Vadar_024645 [Vaccinium darrowii]
MEPPPPSPPPLATATAEAPPPPDVQIQSQNTPSETPPSHCQTENPNKAMANFKAFVMAIAASNPRRPLTPPLKTLIQNRFAQFFPDSHTPIIPLMLLWNSSDCVLWDVMQMIIAALGDLNEEGGSSEESISKIIKNKYNDLPRAHSTFLKLHIWKLLIVEQYQVEEQRDEARKVQNQAIILDDAVGCGGSDEKTREQKLQTSVIEEQKQPEEEQNDVSKGQTLGQQIEVIEGKGISLEQKSGVIMEPDKRQKQEIKLPENRSQMAEHQSRVVEGLSWSQIHKQLQQEQEKPHPRKLVIRLRPPIPESSTVANVYESFPLDHCHDKEPAETQQKYRARGRPPKCKSSAGQPRQRRRGRPPKLRQEADETTGLSLNSSFQDNPLPQMQQEKNRVLGRTPKCKSSAGGDMEIHKISSNSSIQASISEET